MVSEDHPLVGGNVIAPIVQPLGRGGTVRIEHEHFGRDEFAVEAVTDGVGADCGHHQPHGADLFAPMQGNRSQCEGAQCGNPKPDKKPDEFPDSHESLSKPEVLCPILLQSAIGKLGSQGRI